MEHSRQAAHLTNEHLSSQDLGLASQNVAQPGAGGGAGDGNG